MDKESHRESQKGYRDRNRERLNAAKREYYRRNRERILAGAKAHREARRKPRTEACIPMYRPGYKRRY